MAQVFSYTTERGTRGTYQLSEQRTRFIHIRAGLQGSTDYAAREAAEKAYVAACVEGYTGEVVDPAYINWERCFAEDEA